jgi:hypothetical protein
MRIFLKEAKQVGPVSYPAAGFYNAPDELAAEWIAAGLALPATDANEIIEQPVPEPVADEQPKNEEV